MRLAPLSRSSRRVGMLRSMRVVSATVPFFTGTLRSSLTMARRPLTSRSSMVRIRGIARASTQALLHRLDDGFGRQAEMAVEIFMRGAGAEAVHADEYAVEANETVPALADGGFDADADLLLAQNGAPVGLRLLEEK